MKKFTIVVCMLLAFTLQMKAQQYVSTEPANRNVIIEEFTGRNCGYCPDGHVVANGIVSANPDRAWAINIHAGGFSPTTYPNFQCQDGIAIHNAFSISGYPAGTVNRQGTTALGRNQWPSAATAQLAQPSELNIAGQAVVDIATRIATITVEVYYTADSPVSTNYLTVAMLQDSIMGSQSGGSSNPSQWINGTYCHMHILRDVVSSSDAWGDEITTTTAGTLVTRTYVYEIPENIGNPNGVDVDLDNIHFLAWVTKDHYYVLSANALALVYGSDEPINPALRSISQENVISCGHSKNFIMNVLNGGTDELTSLTFELEIEGQTTTKEWTGNLASYANEDVEITADVPFGTHSAEFRIVSANGQSVEVAKTNTATCDEWQEVQIDGDTEELTIKINQDRFGNQITWKVYASDMSVLGEGGPYTMLMSNSTLMHEEHVTVPANECVKFVLSDQVGNGICCAYGDGYYQILDSQENILVDGNGEFESEASHILSIMGEVAAAVTTGEVTEIDDDKATLNATITAGTPIVAGFWYRAEGETEYTHIHADEVATNFSAIITDLTPETTYYYKAFMKMDESSNPVFGEEKSFITSITGMGEVNAASYKVYPNPVNSILYVNGMNMDKVMIYNTVGQLVNSIEVNNSNAQINVESLQNGVYFVRVTSENGSSMTKKITIIK